MRTPAYLDWHPGPAWWVDTPGELEAIQATAAFVFTTHKARLALTKVTQRDWDLPGGHIEPHESPVQAAIREAQEEIGLPVSNLTFVGGLHLARNKLPYPEQSSLWFFATEVPALSPLTPSLECEDARWVPFQEVHDLCFNKSWLPLFNRVILP